MKTEDLTLPGSEKISLVSNLSTMLSAGIPILEAVDSIREDSKGNSLKVLNVLREDLVQGNQVSFSFSKFPKIFDPVTTSVIRASEEAGTLDITLRDLKNNIQKEIEFTDKVRSALLYPAFITLVFFGVLLLILIVVVPKLALVFERLRVDLPLPTKVLIFLSDLLIDNTLEVVVVTFLLVVGGSYVLRKKKTALANLLFSVPLISKLVQQIDLTRFSRSLYLLLSSGLPITVALDLTSNVVISRKMANLIAHSREMVLSGKRLSEGFREGKNVIPIIMIKLIEAGEKTGSLDKSMKDISQYFDYQVTGTLRTFTALLEPIMLVGVGIIVGGMMLAIVTPIYGLIGQVGSL